MRASPTNAREPYERARAAATETVTTAHDDLDAMR